MDMSALSWLARGLLLGFAIAAPVGPIGVLCIRRSLAEGWLTGFLTGMGAATADGFYGGVAAFGLTAISGVLVAEQGVIRIAGGLLLCYLGARTLLTKPAPEAAAARRGDAARGAVRAVSLRGR
jgi:threonine/homoserine/homoserine lactone efflux protein